MGFINTSLIFAIVALVGTFFTGCCCNRGSSSKQLLHVTLFNTATVCCWMMWAIVYLAQMKPLIVPILNEGE